MIQAIARVSLLACLLSFSVPAKFLVNDYLITPKAEVVLDQMSDELQKKTGLSAYVIATTAKLKQGANLYEFVKQYEGNASEPYVFLVFAPNAIITQGASQTGRLGLIPSSKRLEKHYDKGKVLSYFNEFIGSDDSNSLQSKYDVAVLHAYSELADELAASKEVILEKTLKDNYGWITQIFLWIVRVGTVILFWIYFVRPLYMRIRYGKQ
jgi:hypothetical protein